MAAIRKPLKRFLPHLLKAKEEALNEADTVQRLVLFFHDVLGYDQLTELTRELQIRDKFVDLAVKIDGAIRLLVEIKSAGTTLRDRHLDQVERYAADGNHRWALLTNGLAWKMYHLTFEEGIEYEKVFDVNLEADDLSRAADLIGLLHHSALLKGDLEEYWRRRQALDPESLAKALFTENALRLLRRQIRRREGILLDIEDLADAMKEMFTPQARERMGVIRIQRARRPQPKKQSTQPQAPPPLAPADTPSAPPSSPISP